MRAGVSRTKRILGGSMRCRLSSFVLSLAAVCLLAVPAFSAPESQPAPAGENAGSAPASARAASYSGNTKSRVFHAANCRYFNCKSCTEQFRTADEARKSGYKPCKLCIR